MPNEETIKCTVERPGVVTVTIEAHGALFDDIYDACEQACLGLGYSPETVKEWFRREI